MILIVYYNDTDDMMQGEPKLNQVFSPRIYLEFWTSFLFVFIVIEDFMVFICGMIRTFHIGVILKA